MASMERVLELNFSSEDEEQILAIIYDWSLPRAFSEQRHWEKIEPTDVASPQSWRMKERMKTVSVAIVICLNVGVDPPGIVKTQPCARLECWTDPATLSPQKALETIGNNLQKQYERWQPRARYKTSLDPTVEEVKKLCTSLRRNAKDERVLFHYNGHGVPQPTNNGEIWVFNRNYTQYIPLSIYDLQAWMGSPSIYVYDCSNAGLIIKSFHNFAEQHEKEYDEMLAKSAAMSSCPPPNFSGCIQLAACSENQILPMNADLPADLFTSCLTTPIRTALRWFVLQYKNRMIPRLTLEMIEKVPGQLNDRRTMLGELNWIFTAITDTIAWNVLPKNLFQKLFRQDLLVASLFRNYLLAERIMRTYDCTPTSSPKLPSTAQHPMWVAWDLALDLCLSQLPGILDEIQAAALAAPPPPVVNGAPPPGAPNGNNNTINPPAINLETAITSYSPSPFFEEQLTAFQVWLEYGSETRKPPEQLPIVLQVLLSQVHRVRALELLGRFLDLGWWAVNLALSVGIFPYVLKLLQSSAKELRPLLVFIWAKILAVDHSCQTDLVRDGSHKYFVAMVGDTSLPYDHRTMAVFVLTNIVRTNRSGQQAALQANSISTCLEVLVENDRELRRWVCICLGLTWVDFSAARWCGVRDSAHEKMYSLLDDPHAEVRAAAVFALGTFLNSGSERTEHSNAIDHSVAMTLVTKLSSDEASPLVRQEIVVALHNFILIFEKNFVSIEQQQLIAQELAFSPVGGVGMRRISSQTKMKILSHASPMMTVTGAESHLSPHDSIKRASSSNSLSSLFASFSPKGSALGKSALALGGIYGKVYSAMLNFEKDPTPGVALLAKTVIGYVRTKARALITTNVTSKSTSGGGPLSLNTSLNISTNSARSASPDRPDASCCNGAGGDSLKEESSNPLIATKYIEWCWDRFARPNIPGEVNGLGFSLGYPMSSTIDSRSQEYQTREWRFMRNNEIRRTCFRRPKSFPGRLEDHVLHSRNIPNSHSSTPNSVLSSPSFTLSTSSTPSIIRLHEFERLLLTSEGSSFSVHEIGELTHKVLGKCENSSDSRITSIEWVNSHDNSLVMVGGDDGTLRFWKVDLETGKSRLITGWNSLTEVGQLNKSSKSFGLLSKWDAERERVIVAGDTKVVRIWDARTEMKKGDWTSGSEGSVTSVDTHRCEPNLVVIALEEGAVRVIDIRLPPAEAGTMTFGEFNDSWVVGAGLRYDRIVVAGSAAGKIKFFDLRMRNCPKTIESTTDITSFSAHPHLPYVATGCLNHAVNIYGYVSNNAFMSNQIKDGLFVSSGRMGAVSSVHLHPYKPLLATCDSYAINLYQAKGWTI